MMRLVKRTVQLIPLRISNGAFQLKGSPKRLKLLNWGVNDTVYGPVIVNETTARLLPMNQKSAGFDTVALDYEHNTVPGTPEFERTKEPREIAANGVPLVVPGEGLFLDQLGYTPSGERNHLNYIDLSPTPKLTPAREVCFLHSVALCRQGAVEDLHYFSVAMEGMDQADIQTQTEEEKVLMDKIMTLLRKALGLKPDATDDEVCGAVQSLSALGPRIVALEGAVQPLVALTAADGKLTVLSVGLDGLKGKIGDLDIKSQITTFSSELDDVRRDLICYQAHVEGKVIQLTADQRKALPLDTLKSMVEKITPTVPLTAVTPLNVQPHLVNGKTVDAASAAKIRAVADRLMREQGITFQQAWAQAQAQA